MAKTRQRSRFRILLGIVLIFSGLGIWYTSYVKSIQGGLRAGANVPGFSVYNGSLHFWADFNGDSETHFRFSDLEFLETGTDGGNEMLMFGMFDGPNSASYKCDFDLPLWFIPAGGLVWLVLGLRGTRRAPNEADSETGRS